MVVGDVVYYGDKSNLKIGDAVGYVSDIRDGEANIVWNNGIYDWTNISKLSILNVTEKDNAEYFRKLFSNRHRNIATSFDDYIKWVDVRNGFNESSEQFLSFGNKKYPLVEFIRYVDGALVDYRFDRKFVKAFSKLHYVVYRTKANGFAYDESIYYLLDMKTKNVYFVGLSKQYSGYASNLKILKTVLSEMEYNVVTSDEDKLKDNLEYEELWKYLFKDNVSRVRKNRVLTEKQFIYICQLLTRFHNLLKKHDRLYLFPEFKYYERNKYYLLEPTDEFISLGKEYCVQSVINALNNAIFAMSYGNAKEGFVIFEGRKYSVEDVFRDNVAIFFKSNPRLYFKILKGGKDS